MVSTARALALPLALLLRVPAAEHVQHRHAPLDDRLAHVLGDRLVDLVELARVDTLVAALEQVQQLAALAAQLGVDLEDVGVERRRADEEALWEVSETARTRARAPKSERDNSRGEAERAFSRAP